MFKNTRTHVCRGLASLVAVVLLGTCAPAWAQPTFPGFPTTPGTPGSYETGGNVYTPFNPLGGGSSFSGAGSSLPNPFPPYPWYPQYYMDPVGSYLYGSSAVIGSVGQFQMNQESAQILHQMALQKDIETKKMLFDLERYIKENTPTFTDVQMQIAKETLKRILQNATPGEIWNGKALNILLNDLKKQPDVDKVVAAGKIPESTLRQLNIASPTGASLGILKDKGRFNWPIALLDDKIVPKEQRDAVQLQAEQLVTKAFNGTLDANLYKDLKANIAMIREKLISQVLTMDTAPYLQAKNFLDNFDSALSALTQSSQAVAYLEYLNFIKGGRTMPELVTYMKNNGLIFAPASPGDEPAYDALYSSLASYDLMFNTQLLTSKKKPKE
jgi:hypothetical protein